jgi:hypothetical protein|nr:MAG TPA: Protein of unknown function (DUF1642) [Bacteriophage sp.]
MNKQELIKNIRKLSVYGRDLIEIDEVSNLVNQLDEPGKVKVSEEEAKFLKTFDFNCESDVTKALYNISRTGWGYYLTDNDGIELKDLTQGFSNLENKKRLIKAVLDGYEIKKEKRYVVKIPVVNQYLVRVKDENFLGFLSSKLRTYFTRKELEDAGFGWVFDCEGIEIEEVTE